MVVKIGPRRARRVTGAEMKYVRKTAGYIGTDYKTNTDCKRTKQPQFWTKYRTTEEIGFNI